MKSTKSLLGRLADAIDVKPEDKASRSVERRIRPMSEIKGAMNITGRRIKDRAARPTDSVVKLLDGRATLRYYDDGSLRLDGGRAHRGHAARVARQRRRWLTVHHSLGTRVCYAEDAR